MGTVPGESGGGRQARQGLRAHFPKMA